MKIFNRVAIAALTVAGVAATAGVALADDYEGEATAATRKAAVKHAIADWKQEVLEETGRWARWKTASGKEVRCETERNGMVECEVEATPHH